MTDKEKIIKEAWGDFYNLGVGIDENGWLRGDYITKEVANKLKTKDFIETKKRATHDLGFYDSSIEIFRPTSLQGIEDNNGWIKIESEQDLPKESTDCFCILKSGCIIIANSRGDSFWCSDNKWLYNYYDLTHYQLIVKPKKPIY